MKEKFILNESDDNKLEETYYGGWDYLKWEDWVEDDLEDYGGPVSYDRFFERVYDDGQVEEAAFEIYNSRSQSAQNKIARQWYKEYKALFKNSEDIKQEELKEEDLPDVELEEPITISDTKFELEEPSEEVVDNAYLGLLNSLISKEWDMINEYKSIIATLELDKQEELIAILNSVVDEKTIQLGMLNKAVELLDDDSVELMQQGEDKAEEILAETEAPLDESLTEAKHKPYIEVADDFYDEISYKICVANNIEKDINKYGSDAYWINDSLANLQDLEDLYKTFVLPTKDEQLINDFKEIYLHGKEPEEELDENLNKGENK